MRSLPSLLFSIFLFRIMIPVDPLTWVNLPDRYPTGSGFEPELYCSGIPLNFLSS